MVAQVNIDRVRFGVGKQREFLDLVRDSLQCVSIRGILQFGFNIPYSTLKSYYNENRLLPRDLFEDLCRVARIDVEGLGVEYLKWNWGLVRGGRLGKRKS